MPGPRIRRSWLVLTSAALAIGLAACSSGSSSTNAQASGPELTHITVDTLEVPDEAALEIAQKDGFFKQQGLTVTVVTVPAPEPNLLVSHTADFTMENYVSMYTSEQQDPSLQLREVADDVQAAPGVFELMVPKNSKITSPAQLKGATIAFPGPGPSIGSLSLNVLLSAYHIPANDFKTAIVPFPDMPASMARGQYDAYWVVEPFVTIMEAQAGARSLTDLMTGPLENFPVSCWATTESFIDHYPRTVAAFQRAIVKAQQIAASNQSLVRSLLPKFITGLPSTIANVMALGTYNTTISLTRMERVADVMQEYNILSSNFDVKSMYYALPSGT
jgi:NitT/TauT family transport system substrate-binding protein